MRGDDDAEFLRELQRVVQLVVGDAERAFVSEEDFETLMPRFTISSKLRFRFVVEARHAHVKGEIAGALSLGLCHPKFECLQRLSRSAPGKSSR